MTLKRQFATLLMAIIGFGALISAGFGIAQGVICYDKRNADCNVGCEVCDTNSNYCVVYNDYAYNAQSQTPSVIYNYLPGANPHNCTPFKVYLKDQGGLCRTCSSEASQTCGNKAVTVYADFGCLHK